MNPAKEQLSQLVQDVIDGNESAISARFTLKNMKFHIKRCLEEIEPYVEQEKSNGNSKAVN